MHGIVMQQLKNFVTEQYGRAFWKEIKSQSTDRTEFYLPLREYPDAELQAILSTLVAETGIQTETLLYEFGIYAADGLLTTYNVYIDDSWEAIDLVANVETYIHTALRRRSSAEFTPPKLESSRLDPETVEIVYRSQRELCPFAKGLLMGIAANYDTEFVITESQCMHEGADECVMLIQQQAASTAEPTDDLRDDQQPESSQESKIQMTSSHD